MTKFEELTKLKKLEDIFTGSDLKTAHEIMETLAFQGVKLAGSLVHSLNGGEVLNLLIKNHMVAQEADFGNHGGEIKPYTAITVLDSVKRLYLNEYYKNDIRR